MKKLSEAQRRALDILAEQKREPGTTNIVRQGRATDARKYTHATYRTVNSRSAQKLVEFGLAQKGGNYGWDVEITQAGLDFVDGISDGLEDDVNDAIASIMNTAQARQ